MGVERYVVDAVIREGAAGAKRLGAPDRQWVSALDASRAARNLDDHRRASG
jgi:hypothetical protein